MTPEEREKVFQSHTTVNKDRGLRIRLATVEDFEKSLWPNIIKEIVRQGETYAYPTDMTKEQAVMAWMQLTQLHQTTWLVEDIAVADTSERILGTYYLKTNAQGPGQHVCNCGYMVSPTARGRGIATWMCQHSQTLAVALGYKAMQFNFVASTNVGAVRLWQTLGYDIVGTLPKAFCHPKQGYVDAYVMYKWLATNNDE